MYQRINRVLIETSPKSWKAKRTAAARPSEDRKGRRPGLHRQSRIVTDKALQDQVIEEYPRKYLMARMGIARPTREKIDSGQICVIHITPVHDFPDGFTSNPGTPAPKPDAQ